MGKILIRAGMLPTEDFDHSEMLRRNLIGSNAGNLVYQYAVFKVLMADPDTSFIPTRYKKDFLKSRIDEINSTCECFVIPLADAFRKSFVNELDSLTALVKALKIPCVVIGAGVRAPLGAGELRFGFDENVKAFVSAVLDKSALIGLRGEISADYLSRLGFVPERDFTVIGCPSMFAQEYIKIKDRLPGKDADIAFNLSPGADKKTIAFIRENAKSFKSYTYIPQNLADLKIMAQGEPRAKKTNGFPCDKGDPLYAEGRAYFPESYSKWRCFIKDKDFTFGTRLHGNIMGVLAGIPSMHIPFDARTSEVVKYHALTHVSIKEALSARDIFELIEKADFHSPERVHRKNLEHYTDFLNANGLEHIYLPGKRRDILKEKMSDGGQPEGEKRSRGIFRRKKWQI